jgi:hypothetical protein
MNIVNSNKFNYKKSDLDYSRWQYWPKSILCVPIFADKKVIGVLELKNKLSDDEGKAENFEPIDEAFSSCIASFLANIIETCRALEDFSQRFKTELDFATRLENEMKKLGDENTDLAQREINLKILLQSLSTLTDLDFASFLDSARSSLIDVFEADFAVVKLVRETDAASNKKGFSPRKKETNDYELWNPLPQTTSPLGLSLARQVVDSGEVTIKIRVHFLIPNQILILLYRYYLSKILKMMRSIILLLISKLDQRLNQCSLLQFLIKEKALLGFWKSCPKKDSIVTR